MTVIENLPAPVRETGLFCCWRYEERKGKKTKVPYNPVTGLRARSNDPATFAPLSVAAAASGPYDGLGVGIFNGLCAIDLDHCLENGCLNELATDVALTMNTYTEFSPSGEGLRLLFYAPGFQYDTERYYINNRQIGMEVYVCGATKKYVTVTGNVYGIDVIAERSKELAAVLEKHMVRPQTDRPLPTPGAPAEVSDLDDLALIQRARDARNGAQFSRLWAGDITGYPSQSEADLALCNALAFWTGRDMARMDRLFRQSGLMRDKWDRAQSGSTYGAITLENAVRSCREVYTPGGKAPQREERKREVGVPPLETISARELQNMKLPPVEWIVRGMLPTGLAILASPPKYGKSWWVLDLCLSVASGLPFMERQTVQGRALYLALEDGKNRLQGRMNKLLASEDAPECFDFTTRAGDLGNGLTDQLETYILEHPDIRLIVIDTLQKIRGAGGGNESAYQRDYREAGQLKQIADRYRLCILLVHHLRKMGDEGDPFNRISGTNGLLGAADTAFVMVRAKRTDTHTTFSVTGRDVTPIDEVIAFDKETCKWERIGTVDHLERQAARMEYDQNDLVIAVKKLLEKNPDGWKGSAAELMEECGALLGYYPEPSARSYTAAMKRLKPLLWNYDRISVDTSKKVHNTRQIYIVPKEPTDEVLQLSDYI